MQTCLPQWPRSVPRLFKPIARYDPRWTPDLLALARAKEIDRRMHANQCSGITGTWSEQFWSNAADYNAIASFTSELSLLSGVNDQPVIPALFFHNKLGKYRTISFLARGVLSVTGTPTYVFQFRLGTTSGSTYLSGTSVGVSKAITTASGVTNQWWEARLDLTCYTPGIGTGNTILSGSGYVTSPGGFAAPYSYALEPTTPDTATWTSTIDCSITQYLNLSVTCSASSSSNTLTLKQLMAYGWN